MTATGSREHTSPLADARCNQNLPFGLSGFECDMTNAINYVNCMLIDFASENDLELYLKSREEIMTSELYDPSQQRDLSDRLCLRSGIRTSSGYL